MANKPSDYEQGKRNGVTEANLEAIASTLDRIWDRLDSLPCAAHGGAIASAWRAIKYQWALILLLLSAVGGLAVIFFT